MEIVVQILLGLGVIALGFFLWKSAQRWTWVPLVIVPVIFIEAVFFMGLVAQSSKARIAWQKVIVDLQERLGEASDEQELLKYGQPGQDSDQNAVVPLELALQRLRTDAGRVWRGLVPQGGDASKRQFTLAMPPQAGAGAAAPAAGAAAAAGGNAQPAAIPVQIPAETIIYAFSERDDPNLVPPNNKVPNLYLGEFQVVQSSPQSVTLQATTPLSSFTQLQQTGINSPGTWAIYELTPIDGHEPFIRANSRPLDDAIFGEVDDQFVNQALANANPETLASYLKDGTRAQADDAPEARWLKIEFTQNHTIIVDSQDQRNALDGGYFDTLGQSVDSRLQIPDSNEVSFRTGTQLVLKMEAANELISEGVAMLIDEIYVRPLNDYEERGRHVFERQDILAEKEIILKRETATLQGVSQINDQLLIAGQEDKIKLEAELKQYRVEKAAIEKHVAELNARQQKLKSQLAALYQSNVKLARDLERAQMFLKQQIDERTASVNP